jgi:hypothetical protein
MKPGLLALYQNFDRILGPAGKSRNVRRIFHAAALAFTQIPFRAFIKPLGFNFRPQQSSESFRTFVNYLRSFGDFATADGTMRNVRDFIQTVSFSGVAIDTQDRRSLRAILASFFSPAVLSDAFRFLEPDSQESDIWKFPDNRAGLAFLKPIPLFPSLDVLMVNRETSEVFRYWNLGLWLSRPFLSILAATEDSKRDRGAVAGITESEVEAGSSRYMRYFWIGEIAAFNASLSKRTDSEDRQSECRQFLVGAAKAEIPKVVRLDFLGDPKSFFETLKLEIAERCRVEPTTLTLEFHFARPDPDDLIIEGLHIFNGCIEGGILCPPAHGAKAFAALRNVRFQFVGNYKPPAKAFICPMLRHPAAGGGRVESEAENFVVDVVVETRKGDRFWLLNATAIYITVPDIFL